MKHGFYLFFTAVLTTLFISCAGVKHVLEEPASVPENLAVVFTNSTAGFFEPEGCGCRHKGGLARRAYFINEARKRFRSVIALDTGNMFFGNENQPGSKTTAKADYMFDALSHMGIDALNIGAQDCALGISYLLEKGKKLAFPLLSANIKSLSTDRSVFSPYIIKTAGNRKIGIFGLSKGGESMVLQADGVYIDSPVQSAQKAVKNLRDMGCSVVIMLSQLSEAENKNVAQQVSGVNFILGSSSKTLLRNPKLEGNTAILSPGSRGTHAAILEINFENDSFHFYNAKNKDTVKERLGALKEQEKNPENPSNIDTVMLKIALLKEKLKTFEGKNSFKYAVFPLDNNTPNDNHVSFLVEKYKDKRLRNSVSAFVDGVQSVDMSTLSEDKKLAALRLMNDISCDDEESIAVLASSKPFCRELANIIADCIKKGEGEGKIRYRIVYEKGKKKKSLDNEMLLP